MLALCTLLIADAALSGLLISLLVPLLRSAPIRKV